MVIVDKVDLSKYSAVFKFHSVRNHWVWGLGLLAVINGIMSSALYHKIMKENV